MFLPFFRRHTLWAIIVCSALIFGAGWYVWNHTNTDPLAGRATTTVTRGAVEQIVSVSGITRSEQTAELAFPATGIVTEVLVREGDTVTASSVLATLGSAQERAALSSAEAELALAKAELAELVAGTRSESLAITDAAARNAEAELARTVAAENTAVENAKNTLYSSGLIARTNKPNEDAIPPTVSGTYRCDTAGTYTINIYTSRSQSGYSANVTGLETGVFALSTDQPLPIGKCGLYLQIIAGVTYDSSSWNIEVPNSSSDAYITNKNALTSAEITAKNKIAAATEALDLAKRELTLQSAAPRSEAVAQAQARVAGATAKVASARATLADHSIVAPFTGTITDVAIIAGETATAEPVITILEADTFEVVARVPEIDITEIKTGQTARVVFDADSKTEFVGTVTYLASLPVEIDGVSYFEAKITLTNTPDWLRGGLNADVDIITSQKTDTLRVPSRYVTTLDAENSVQTLDRNGNVATTTIEVTFRGNDGYIGITGLTEGSTVIAP